MGSKKDLEKVLEEDISPAIDQAIEKHLGISIAKLREDITRKLRRNPLAEMEADLSLDFKTAKKAFRKEFLERLLRANGGDISKAARAAGTDRRTIHRLAEELGIDTAECRKHKLSSNYLKKEAISTAIGETLKLYKEILHPKKMAEIYKEVPELSEKILEKYPLSFPTLRQAEEDFERRYIEAMLKKKGWNISSASREMGIRFETLHRKIRELGISKIKIEETPNE